MKSFGWLLLIALTMSMAISVAFAGDTDPQTPVPIQHGPRFVDENGDGFNDLAPDHDGDGIPNGQDADYTKPQDGSGTQQGIRGGQGRGRGLGQRGPLGFVDANGDGICDNAGLRSGRSGFGPARRGNALKANLQRPDGTNRPGGGRR
ncbi:hypothetical protein KQI63_04890 [bacterium]|nr:hypothetical protein [bacterium]